MTMRAAAMPIRILPPAVADKIAAGEVIDRPASVVKELVENALDAGATEIAVVIEGGGAQLIRVQDNGCGMTPEEASIAFERHATSKIQDADDLLRIHTLGFRGEALPSIAAVAEVELLTRTPESLAGARLVCRKGKVARREPAGAPLGTTITVRDLFHDFPARRKFLRSNATEAAQCAAVVSQYALARPDVRFILSVDGRQSLHTGGSDDLQNAAADVLGASAAANLLEIVPNHSEEFLSARNLGVIVSGLISRPGLTRSSRGAISLFVNGRAIQHRGLNYAVEQAYQGTLMIGRHPIAILHISMPPEELDVNVHPRKLEVRFRQEQEMFAAVQRAVRRTLVASSPSVATDDLPVVRALQTATQALQSAFVMAAPPAAPEIMQTEEASTTLAQRRKMPLLRVIGQVGNTYVITEASDGMYLVDQHAAHERVLFERIQQRLTEQALERQGLLDPVLVELHPQDALLLTGERHALERYGIEVEGFGDRQVLVRALPAGMRERDLSLIINDALAGLQSREGLRDRMAASIACHSAVRAGDVMTFEEMRALLGALEESNAPQTCPHGRPTMMHLSAAQLEKEFGRRG